VHSVPVKSCLSFLPASQTDLNEILHGSYSADLIEFRFDHLKDVPFSDIRKSLKQPVIITLRMPEEGGFWKSASEERIPL
jgi:3-dehydroquinate dehydratase